MSEAYALPEGLRYVETYFANTEKASKHARHMKHPPMAGDPPTSGRTRCFVVTGAKHSTLFHPFTLWSEQLPNRAAEIALAKDVYPFDRDLVVAILKRQWELRVRLRVPVDLDVGALVLNRLGEPVPVVIRPTSDEDGDGSQRVRGGKAVDEAVLRNVDPRSRRGGVLAFFMEGNDGRPKVEGQEALDEGGPDATQGTEDGEGQSGPAEDTREALGGPRPAGTRSIREAMAELGLTRSGVLSHLFCLNRDHGIGYTLQSDCATVLLPEGWNPFDAPPAPEPSGDADSPSGGAIKVKPSPQARAPRRSGKPNANVLTPIPEGSKRALVAAFFARGPATCAECEAATGVGARSAQSHLHDIHSFHGIGYSVEGDRFALTPPPGFVLTCPKKPRKERS